LPAWIFYAPGLSSAAIPQRCMLLVAGVDPEGAGCAKSAR
jgi:hypothetical protein